MNRRELIVGAAAASLAGFPIPEHDAPTSGFCTFWMVVVGGHCHSIEGIDELDEVERKAVRLGWKALDRRHVFHEQSRVLVRRTMSRKAARALERGIIGGDWSELPVYALWIEVPG